MTPLSLHALARVLDTRRRIERRQWLARAVVIRAQLDEMRARLP